MSDSRSSLVALPEPVPDQDVIDAMNDLLRRAERGDFNGGFVFTGVDGKGNVLRVLQSTKYIEPFTLLGALESLKIRIYRKWLEGSNGDPDGITG